MLVEAVGPLGTFTPDPAVTRDVIFISKATPGDDEFVLWLGPRLEAAGYTIFADLLTLEPGDGGAGSSREPCKIGPSRCCCAAATARLLKKGFRKRSASHRTWSKITDREVYYPAAA